MDAGRDAHSGRGVPAETRRLSFGERAAEYDRYRPSYPPEAVLWAIGEQRQRVVDVGAGTGLLSGVLVRCGHQVVAVEPDRGMRDQATTRLGADVEVVDGSAESLPLEDESVDALFVAQAFHWFDLTVALPEMARVVRPGGHLVVLWNVRDDDVDWVEALSAIVGRSDARSGSRDLGVPEIEPWFGRVERATFRNHQTLDADALVGLVDTYSHVALHPDRNRTLSQVRDLSIDHPGLAGRTTFDLPYETIVYRARR
ncbi:MAG: class I SAM-dependent methyltransferase [Actinomycetes bacterium]